MTLRELKEKFNARIRHRSPEWDRIIREAREDLNDTYTYEGLNDTYYELARQQYIMLARHSGKSLWDAYNISNYLENCDISVADNLKELVDHFNKEYMCIYENHMTSKNIDADALSTLLLEDTYDES